ncbi:MAG: hypothetical protein WCP14_02490 [bacterium]
METNLIKDKKTLYIVAISGLSLALLVIIGLIYLVQQSTTAYDARTFKELASNDKWTPSEEYPNCEDNESTCINYSIAVIRAGIKNDLAEINYNPEYFDKDLSEATDLIKQNNYKQALEKTNLIIFKEKEMLNEYQNDFQQIDDNIKGNVDIPFESVNKKIINDWAISWIKASYEEVEDAMIIQKKEEGIWRVVYGPGTDYDSALLNELGIPLDIINLATGLTTIERYEIEK